VAHSWPKRRLDDWLNHAEWSKPPGKKGLQMTTFRDVCRRSSLCLTRPVTPEVAGSSPVAPVKYLQIRMLRCHNRRQICADYTDLSAATPETARSGPKSGVEFKPIRAALRLSARAACNYTKRPEVTAAPRPLAGASARGRISSWMRRRERQQPPACAPAAS
jgi:hypothetical protein